MEQEHVLVSKASERIEAVGGVLIAFFAALMAISDLGNNDIEKKAMAAHNKHNSYFTWYQSKSVKQSLKESELASLETMKFLVKNPQIEIEIQKVKEEITKYKLEKNEIMVGSANIPKFEWVQDLDGKMGVIEGVKELEKKVDLYDAAGAWFDVGSLFFQISLVLGAVCVIIYDNPKLQKAFVIMMILMGTSGCIFSLIGYFAA